MPRSRSQKITPRALLEIKVPTEVHIAPDGFRIAYCVSQTDWDDNTVSQHVYVTTTADDGEPRQVTRGLESETEPRWSPDGKWLAFLSARDDPDDDSDDDPKQQVYLLPMDGGGGEAEKLTSAPEGVEAYDWLPDGFGIVYLAREPRPRPVETAYQDKQDDKNDAVVERAEKFRHQIWQIDCEDKKARLIHPGDWGIGEIRAAPDGTRVAFTTNYTGEQNDYHLADVWTVEIKSGALQRLTDGPGGKFHPVWTPDSRRVLFTRNRDPELSYSQENLFVVSAAGGDARNLMESFPHEVTGWIGVRCDNEGAIYVLAALGTTTGVFRSAGGSFEAIVDRDEHIHELDVAPDGSLAFVASAGEDAPELYWWPVGAREPVVLTELNDDWHDKYSVAPVQVAAWASPDGTEVEGLLTLPRDYEDGRRYPLIVYLHGGPHGRMVEALTPYTMAQVFAGAGYAVLAPNYRGSEGYGETFAVANRNDLGGGDYTDVMAGVDWAIAEGIADPERLGVIGSSYGGYLTNWIVGHTARFQAAISEFGIFSLVTDFSNSQAPRWELEYLSAYPWDDPARYAALSPATYVQSITTPVLLLHGEGDPNTFIANSQEMYTALRLQGKTVEYAHYPREGHGFGEPQHRLDELRRCLAWFDRYVVGGGKPATHRIGDKIVQDGWELTVTHASLETYAGRGADKQRYLEAAFILRDLQEAHRPITVGAGDLVLRRADSAGKLLRPAGLPLDVLGEKVLAEARQWKLSFTPAAEGNGQKERGLTVPAIAAFRISGAAGTYHLVIKDFPPVTIDVPARDKEDDKDTAKARAADKPGAPHTKTAGRQSLSRRR